MTATGATKEVWILGATGRAVAANLASKDVDLVLVGRNPERLNAVAEELGRTVRTVVAASPEATADEIRRQQPAVVVNTIGPFSETATLIARACLPGGHYVDLANDLTSATDLRNLDTDAVAAGRTLVSGAGFGVLATESVVASLCADRPTPSRVRVDALPSLETQAGEVGSALATTITDIAAMGGRRYEHGGVVRTRLGGSFQRLVLPSGETVSSMAMPSGDLHAAWTASGAPSVTAGSSMLPATPATRALLPVVSALLSLQPLRKFAADRLARVHLKAAARPREHAWGHARIEWADGTSREGWLRIGDASTFTSAAIAEAALRLANGRGRPGVHGPATAFGPDIAVAAGGEFVFD